MYAKLIDGNLQFAKMPLKIGGKHVFTNDENILRAQGYKPVEYTDAPQQEGYYAECEWQETETEIVLVWTLIPIESGE